MSRPDLNLLATLDALLEAGSVAGAAKRLRLTPSAMSRALARLRETTGDPLLVRAGRGLVPTPRAQELREPVARLMQEAQAVLRPAERLDLAALARTFTLRTSEGFVETFGAGLIERAAKAAPGAILRFVAKPDRDSTPLRDGSVDLETGVVGKTMGPEVRTRALFRDRFIGVVRSGHSLAQGEPTLPRYLQAGHVLVTRGNLENGPVDVALARLGEKRAVAAVVGGFSAALALARGSDLVATVPERHTAALRAGVTGFSLPFKVREVTVCMLWHPRMEADPAHRWLRRLVRDVCAERGRLAPPSDHGGGEPGE